ncbi:hypothetical protein [Streptomyces sp. NPDC127119]|uniref:hypothetical protein n=1 Tax=Streptomyces sp. NPDC127119 TaxID=3345370 RepID=UPI0036253AEA
MIRVGETRIGGRPGERVVQVVGEGQRDARSAQVDLGGEDVGERVLRPEGQPVRGHIEGEGVGRARADRM